MPQFHHDDIKSTMIAFGLPEPTEAEIGMFEGVDYIGGGAAIANYVNTKTNQIKAEQNNPLKLFLEEEKVRRKDFEAKADTLYQQLQTTLSAAPKLFGNLTQDQIAQYIAPITQAAKEGSANLEGDFTRRGITGSSIEANALADANRKYQQAVLQTGLQLGLNTQQAQGSAIQNRLNQLFGSSSQSSSLLGSAATGLTDAQMNNMQTITQLPAFLRAMAQQELLLNQQMNKKDSIWDTLHNISGGINDVGNILTLGGRDFVSGSLGKSPSPSVAGNMGSGAAEAGADPAALALL